MRVKFRNMAQQAKLSPEEQVEVLLDYIEERVTDDSFDKFIDRVAEEANDGTGDTGESGGT